MSNVPRENDIVSHHDTDVSSLQTFVKEGNERHIVRDSSEVTSTKFGWLVYRLTHGLKTMVVDVAATVSPLTNDYCAESRFGQNHYSKIGM